MNIQINFKHKINEQNLVIAIAQDYKTLKILMVAYMNKEALEKTLKTKKAHYWSTSRNTLWLKGESSNHFQLVKEVLLDCDMDAILLKVEQIVGTCHTGHYSCFFREIELDKIAKKSYDLDKLEEEDLKIISNKVFHPDEIY